MEHESHELYFDLCNCNRITATNVCEQIWVFSTMAAFRLAFTFFC